MWVYRNGACDDKKPITIFDYQATRKTDHPENFLKDFSGILVTDGYQVYHTLEKKRDGLKVAGCWIHAKRKFMEIVKASGKNPSENIASEAVNRITEIIHMDNQLDDLTKAERKNQRQHDIKPKVDDFFEWAKSALSKLPAASATAKALQYCINQERYLRVFLKNANVPMDNNRAEQSIRPFTLGRKNWVTMYSQKGASASAVLYSIVETAKANNLIVNDYLEYVLNELAKHANDTDRSFVNDLLPWSKTVQKKCRVKNPK